MPEPETKKLNKRQIQTIVGIAVVILVLALLVFTYPYMQMQLAQRMIQSGNYLQAEQILIRLVNNKPQWTQPRYKLAISQLYLGEGQEAANTVISLADTSRLDDLELAIIFMDVAEHLLNTGHGEATLVLANRVLAERPGVMLEQAVVEIGFLLADYYNLPLTLDALNLALSLSEDNWLQNRKAFNILLTKALEAPPHLAEPALDRALELYPNNIIAITRKASLLGDRLGAKEALDYLAEWESDMLEGGLNQEYLETKRRLVFRLGSIEPSADLSKYTLGLAQNTVVELAIQGLNQSWRQNQAGTQFYQLAVFDPEVAFRYGRNLYQLDRWEESLEVFTHLKQYEQDYMDYDAVFSAIDFHTTTSNSTLETHGATADIIQVSPDGNWLAWRRWGEQPWTDEFITSDLILFNLSNNSRKNLGDAMHFQWSPDGNYLAYLTMSSTGLGRLYIHSMENASRFTFPGDYDIIDFNWSGNYLMVQADYNQQTRLIRLSPSQWRVEENLAWELNSSVNSDLAWLTIEDHRLLVHRNRHLPREFVFANRVTSFSDWSPDGHMAVIEDETGKHWIYDHQQGDLTEIESQGKFAGWGEGHQIFWYLPVWERLYVLVRMDSTGSIQEYLPYSFKLPYFDITISDSGGTIAYVVGNVVHISQK